MVANGTVPNANLVNITESSGVIQTLCFSPYGRLTGTSNDPSASPVTCNLPTNGATAVTYFVTPAATVSNSHQLNVTISLGGQVRLCDPSVSVSKNAPNGC
jgi:type IV fimbrial biogenesis protein FimT